MWAAFQRAQLKKEKPWAAVLTDRPASTSDDKKSDPAIEAWDATNEAPLAIIQMPVKPTHLNTKKTVSTAKKTEDALKVIFDARENTQLLRLMDELNSPKKGGYKNIVKLKPRAKMIRDELAMLGNPVDDNKLDLSVLSGLPAKYGMCRPVLENKHRKLVMSDVTSKLLRVEQRTQTVGAAKPASGVKSQVLGATAAKNPWAKKEVVCFYCDKMGHMQRHCRKTKANEAKGRRKPGGSRRDGGEGGGPHAGAALAYTASDGQAGCSKAYGSTSGSSTWVLDCGATSHLAA